MSVGMGFGGGAPTKFKKEYCEQAYMLKLLGYTTQEMANFFEVNIDTIFEWKNTHIEFSDKLREGGELADGKVARSMFQKSIGATLVKKKYKGKETEPYETEITEIPSDTAAAAMWLKSRQKVKWGDSVAIELKHTQELTDEELESEIAKVKKKLDE